MIRGANNRHEARQCALQMLYAVDMTGQDPDGAYRDLVNGGEKHHNAFALELLRLAHRHKQKMDDLISGKSHRWDIHRMALLDHLILRLALCELFYIPDVPPKVTINEAIEIAKLFSTDQSGRFINGLLDAIYNENELVIRGNKNPDTLDGPRKAANHG